MNGPNIQLQYEYVAMVNAVRFSISIKQPTFIVSEPDQFIPLGNGVLKPFEIKTHPGFERVIAAHVWHEELVKGSSHITQKVCGMIQSHIKGLEKSEGLPSGWASDVLQAIRDSFDKVALDFEADHNTLVMVNKDGWNSSASFSYYPEPSPQSDFSELAKSLPGAMTVVQFPCLATCKRKFYRNHHTDTLMNVVIHLNDTERWPREKIADWLDELHDKGQVNIEF